MKCEHESDYCYNATADVTQLNEISMAGCSTTSSNNNLQVWLAVGFITAKNEDEKKTNVTSHIKKPGPL
ncbi:hypothetical protein ANCCEY_15045 [Ancylostoma ceylanicum]|uniref:Uncharacterized protein n=1 Tax=Ancylostoma ceylanicum TaxID=53326 RepID=A0A0D6LDZ1_9BILA|nr:hypothetical protein ANCCEY_15045 [Ancylostoma ceylanicum]